MLLKCSASAAKLDRQAMFRCLTSATQILNSLFSNAGQKLLKLAGQVLLGCSTGDTQVLNKHCSSAGRVLFSETGKAQGLVHPKWGPCNKTAAS